MSDDPQRLLDGGDATDLEREILRSDGDVEPPANARDVVWSAIAARLPSSEGGGDGGAGGTGDVGPAGAGGAPSAASSALIKAAAVLVLAGAVIAGALYVRPTNPSAPAPVATSPPAVPSVEPIAPATAPSPSASMMPSAPSAPSTTQAVAPKARTRPSADVAQPAQAAPAAASTSAPLPATSAVTLDALRDEGALLASARNSLRRGDTRAALSTLELARSRHPNGALIQEREVLTIEALAQSGDADAASRRANAFLRAFPSTPHAAHVREFVR